MKENLRNLTVEVWRQECCEKDAIGMENYDSTFVPLFGDQEIRRAWTQVPCDDIPSYIQYFETYTSADNENPQYFVDDPRIDNQICVGRYRHAFTIVKRHQNTELADIIQILRKGFIQQLVLNGNVTWSEARIADTKQLAGDAVTPNTEAEYLHVTFPYCSPDHIYAIEESLEALDPAAFHPVIDGADFGIMNRMVSVSKPEEDGSFTLHLFLANPRFTLNEYRNFETRDQEIVHKHYRVPKFIAQAIEDAWQAKGRSCDSNYNDTEGYCDIVLSERGDFVDELDYSYAISCRFNRRRIAKWGVDEAEKDSLIAQYASGVAGQSNNVEASPDGRGFWNVIIEITTEIPFHVENYVSTDSAGRITHTEEYLGYLAGDIPALPVQEEGLIVVRRKDKKENCTWDVRDDTHESKPLEAHGKVVADGYEEDITNRDHADEDLGTPINGSIVEANNLPEEDGKKTVRLRTRTNKRQTVGVDIPFTSRETYNESERTEIVKNDVFGQRPPDAQTGMEGNDRFVEVIQADKGDDGKITYVKRHIRKKYLGVAATYDNLLTDTIKGEATERIGVPIVNPGDKSVVLNLDTLHGEAKRATVSFDRETGTLDVTESKTTDKTFLAEQELKVVGGFLYDLYETRQQNNMPRTTADVPTSTPTNAFRKDITINSDTGTVNESLSKQVDKPYDKTAVRTVTYADGTKATLSLHWNKDDIADVLVENKTIGKFYRMSAPQINPVTGSWQYEIEEYENEAHDEDFTLKTGKRFLYFFNQRNLDILANHNNFSSLSYSSEYGTWSFIVEIESDFHVERFKAQDSAGGEVWIERYLNYLENEIPPIPVASVGVIVTRSKTRNDDWTWDVQDSENVSKPIIGKGAVYAEGFTESLENRSHSDQDLSAAATGSIVTANNIPEEDGKHTVRISVRTNNRQTIGVSPNPPFISRETYNELETTEIVKNEPVGTPPPNAKSDFEGSGERYIETVQAEKGDDGKITHVKRHVKKKKITNAAIYDSLGSDTITGVTEERLGIPVPLNPDEKAVEIDILTKHGEVKRTSIAFDREAGTLDVTEVANTDKPFVITASDNTNLLKIIDGYLYDLYETNKLNTMSGSVPAVDESKILELHRKDISVNADSGTVNEIIQKQIDKQIKKENVLFSKYADGSKVTIDFLWNQEDLKDAVTQKLGQNPTLGEFARISGPSLNPITGSWTYELEFYKNVPHEHPFETKAGKKYVYYFNQVNLDKLEKHNSFVRLDYSPEYGTWTFLCEGDGEDDGVGDDEKYTETQWWERVEDRRRITNPTFGEPQPGQFSWEFDPTLVDTLTFVDQKRIFTFRVTEWICRTRKEANDKIDGNLYSAQGTGIQQLSDDEFRALLIEWWSDTNWVSDGPTHDYGHLNE